MGKSEDLLRMLEPAVRPGNLLAPLRVPRLPIEERSFESLLAEARQFAVEQPAPMESSGDSGNVLNASGASRDAEADRLRESAAGSLAASSALKSLLGVDRVQSASLRGLMARLPSSS